MTLTALYCAYVCARVRACVYQAQVEHKSSSEGKEILLKLVNWTLQCLDIDAARQMPVAVSCIITGNARSQLVI